MTDHRKVSLKKVLQDEHDRLFHHMVKMQAAEKSAEDNSAMAYAEGYLVAICHGIEAIKKAQVKQLDIAEQVG